MIPRVSSQSSKDSRIRNNRYMRTPQASATVDGLSTSLGMINVLGIQVLIGYEVADEGLA